MDSNEIVLIKQGSTWIVQINRPAKKNALTLAMYEQLIALLQAAEADEQVVAVVLSGVGPDFSSGNDLHDFADVELGPDNAIVRFLKVYAAFSKVKIVAVKGLAVGIGSTLLLHSDLVYVEASAKLSMPFVALGLCPEYASSYLLPRLIGHQRAFELLVLGLPVDAARAVELGLVNALVVDAEAHAVSMAERMATLPPQALKNATSLMRAGELDAIHAAMQREFTVFNNALKGKEFAQAMAAFFKTTR